MHGTSKGHLPFNLTTAKSKVCHRIPNVHVPLFSIGQACDANCTAIFNANRMTLVKNEDITIKYKAKPILEGHRAANGLWMVPVPKSAHQQTSATPSPTWMQPAPQHFANSAYHQKNKKDLAIFLHATAGYPPINSFCKAIDAGYFTTWPGLTTTLIRKHLGQSSPTIMDRLKRLRQGIRSTRTSTATAPQPEPSTTAPPDDEEPLQPPRSHMDRNHQVGSTVFCMDELKGIIASDLPGRFPHISSRRMN